MSNAISALWLCDILHLCHSQWGQALTVLMRCLRVQLRRRRGGNKGVRMEEKRRAEGLMQTRSTKSLDIEKYIRSQLFVGKIFQMFWNSSPHTRLHHSFLWHMVTIKQREKVIKSLLWEQDSQNPCKGEHGILVEDYIHLRDHERAL